MTEVLLWGILLLYALHDALKAGSIREVLLVIAATVAIAILMFPWLGVI